MFNSKACRWWNILFFFALVAVNVMAETLPLGGAKTGELSDRYPSHLTPEGYAFMIWNVIYLLIGCAVVYLFRRKNDEAKWMRTYTAWFGLSCLFNISWLLLWHQEYLPLSFGATLLLLWSLFQLHRHTRVTPRPALGEIWFIRFPFSLYLGWILTATLVNLQILVQHVIPSRSLPDLPAIWLAAGLLIGGTAVVFLLGSRTRDGVLPLPVAWGFAAIADKHSEERVVFVTAGLAAALLFLLAASLLFFRARERD
ncbi:MULTISPECIES: tryptophan-rich sensory protein [Paenibacillus]|uniref:tryptophan-rich sensory protein n=1 Tax=Paenibacillus TaxID=44249 RepID=UPI002FE1CAC4